MQNHPRKELMMRAIEEAKESASLGQYAIGALVVGPDGEVLSVGHTTTHSSNDATAHAEVNAIRAACSKLKSRYLFGCWLYTTLEPCPMCTSAVIWAKMDGIVFGATKEDAQDFSRGLQNSKFTWRQIDLSSREIIKKTDWPIQLVEGFMQGECNELLRFASGG